MSARRRTNKNGIMNGDVRFFIIAGYLLLFFELIHIMLHQEIADIYLILAMIMFVSAHFERRG